MSHYIERWCAMHGEWSMDVDNPGDCSICESEGLLPHQQEIASLRASLAAKEEQIAALTAKLEAAQAALAFCTWIDDNGVCMSSVRADKALPDGICEAVRAAHAATRGDEKKEESNG